MPRSQVPGLAILGTPERPERSLSEKPQGLYYWILCGSAKGA